VKAIAPDRTTAPENAVHGASNADREAAHATREMLTIVRLDEQVEMVGLRRVVQQAKARPARARAQRATNGGEDPVRAASSRSPRWRGA
jgi:hypothetical protein